MEGKVSLDGDKATEKRHAMNDITKRELSDNSDKYGTSFKKNGGPVCFSISNREKKRFHSSYCVRSKVSVLELFRS
jgi:hypothetical protein